MTLLLYVAYWFICTLMALLFYGADKRKAVKGKWRVSEKCLLTISFFGSGVGGLWAMQRFRHKTKHWYFTAVNILGLLWQVILLCYLMKNPSWLF